MGPEPLQSRHVSTWIDAGPAEVYTYLADPRNLPQWAAGLASGEVTHVDGTWAVTSPLGDITVEFVPENSFGVADHVVRLPDGQQFYNPLRVAPDVADTGRCEVVFTVRRSPGTSDEQFDADVAAVAADLETLRAILG